MVMKDKLVKHNHYGFYYKIRNFFVAFAALGCLAVAIAVPTYISVKSNQHSEMKAEGDSSEEVNDDLEGLVSVQE